MDEFDSAREGLLQNRLPEACGTLKVGGDDCVDLVDDAEAPLDLGDDSRPAQRPVEPQFAGH